MDLYELNILKGEEVPNFNSIQSELSFETIKKAEEELDALNNGTVNKILSSYGYMLACRKFAKEGKVIQVYFSKSICKYKKDVLLY